MANTQLVNGKVYDWSSVTISTSGMENIEPTEISGLSTLFQTNFFRLFFRYCTGV